MTDDPRALASGLARWAEPDLWKKCEARGASPEQVAESVRQAIREALAAQDTWFVREVRRCAGIGMPLGCCDEWPECSHILAWSEAQS